jgi:hypothetical protein
VKKLMSALMLTACLGVTALADEPAPQAECTITADLRVEGTDTLPCVEKLETAARLARAEWKVNSGMKKRVRR